MRTVVMSLDELQEFFEKVVEKTTEKVVRAIQTASSQTPDDIWFDIEQFCQYHPNKPKKPTVYQWVSEDKVPVHKDGKLRFLKSEIDAWLKSGKKNNASDADAAADLFLSNHKKKGVVTV